MAFEGKRVLISAYDKTGLVSFARGLVGLGFEVVSTGGTFKELHENGIPVTRVMDVTGFPEILDGRVKTLHPRIHGGILARATEEHAEELKSNGIARFHMVVVNLYPFEAVAGKKGITEDELLANIDIGGPALLRAAAKNYENVIAVTSPTQYEALLAKLAGDEDIGVGERREMAVQAFLRTCTYDMAIVRELEKPGSRDRHPKDLLLHLTKIADMRYGENPHQSGAFYSDGDTRLRGIVQARQLHGKALSFNNILDANDALELVRDFDRPTATVVKHTNPCGVASAENIGEAYELAMAADPMAAFGGVIALNRRCPKAAAEQMSKIFVEVLVAPSYDDGALGILRKKKNIRILETGDLESFIAPDLDFKRVTGGFLVQDRDLRQLDPDELKVISDRAPEDDEMESMLFAWQVLRHVKSNSIVFAKGSRTTGIGAGQMSRVDAVRIAAFKAGEEARGSAMASDAFFPFRDGIDEAARAGVTAVIQPGGSIRDREVIEAVNEHGMAMVFTGVRTFRH